MTIITIKDRHRWDEALQHINPNTFLQSWEWGRVQQDTGERIMRFGFIEQDQIIGLALVVIVNAKRGRHYLIPHGPIFEEEQKTLQHLPALVQYLRQRARQDRVVALRIAPLLEDTPDTRQTFTQLGFRPAPLHVHAELTWVLDINKPAEQLLQDMRKTTRHAITKARRAGVTVEIIKGLNGLDRFLPLYQVTKTRHHFTPFSRNFLKVQLDTFAQHDHLFIAYARYRGQDVAAAVCLHLGSTVFYHHGASNRLPKGVPASQLLQWEAIQEAKRRGATRYNFWGIAPPNQPRHPFAGITVFKQGFGGRAINYLHAQDLPLSHRYWKLWAIDTWRKHRRGF